MAAASAVIPSSSLFGQLMAARREVEDAEGARFAKVYQRRETAAAEAEAKATEASDRQLASTLMQIERDAFLATKMAEHLEKKAEEEHAAAEAESLRVAQELQRAEEAHKAAVEEQLAKDEELALKSQRAEASALSKHLEAATRLWREPRLRTHNVDAGVVVVARLPYLKGVRVAADRDGAALTVTAVPDFSPLLPPGGCLPEGMAPPPEALDVALDLRIVGKRDCSEADVEVDYDEKTGDCRVLVRGAYVTEEQAGEEDEDGEAAEKDEAAPKGGVFARIRRGLSRVLRRRNSSRRALSARGGNSSRQMQSKTAPAAATAASSLSSSSSCL